MIALKITKVGDDVVVVLPDELQQLLGVAEGMTIYAEASDEGDVRLARRDMSLEARRERGRAFMRRYKSTLDELAS